MRPLRFGWFGMFAALVLPGPPLWSQVAIRDERPLPADSTIRRGVLPNGLTYYLRPNGYPAQRVEVRLVVDAGSVHEDPDQRGLAHLLEHLAFDGTPQFPGEAVWRFFERIGMTIGADLNATTGFDETVYQVTLPTDSSAQLDAGLRLVEEWAHRMTLDSLELPRERLVVIEEWRAGLGAGRRAGELSTTTQLAGSRYAERLPIGLPETIRTTGMEPVRRFYRDWYRPDRMAVVVSGDIDPAQLEPELIRRFGAIPAAGPARSLPSRTVPWATQVRAVVAADSTTTGSNVSIVYRADREPLRTRKDFRQLIARNLFDDLLNQRLQARTLEPEPPFLGAGAGDAGFTRDVGGYQLAAEVRAGKTPEGITALLEEVARVKSAGFTSTEFDRARTSFVRGLAQLLDQQDRVTSAEFAGMLVRSHLTNAPVLAIETQVELAREALNLLTEPEVRAAGLARLSDSAPLIVATVPQAGAPSVETLLATYAHQRDNLTAYVERGTDSVLLAELPVAGYVRRSEYLPELGVTRLDLSNGVRVLLKPTTFDRGQVLFTGYRSGGLSRAADSAIVPARTASSIVCGSGLGTHDPLQLTRLLAGRVVGLGCSIAEFEEGMSGSSAPVDLETLLQLAYLQLTAPRLDPQVVSRYRQQLQEDVDHRRADPATALGDSLEVLLSNHSPRARPLDSLFIRQLDAAGSLRFFRSRFSNAAGFTFLLVGAFEVDSVVPLLERYLGGLPASQGVRPGPVPVSPPSGGTIRRTLRNGKEPRSTSLLVFHRAGSPSREEYVRIAATTHVLRNRLEEQLRRQLGGVYGVEVEAELVGSPRPSYQISIRYTADPARQRDLQQAIWREIRALAAGRITEEEVDAFRAERRRSRETASRTNGWWLQGLARADKLGWPLASMLSNQEADQLNLGDIRRTASRYLRDANLVDLTLLPGS